jgi:thiamine-monophosphate kinase
MSKSTESAEQRLIGRYFRPLATHPGAFGLADDAAAITPPPGCDLVLTADGVIAGVHFLPGDPPESIGRKALRMNLSDLAAKGAKPVGFLLSLALPARVSESWIAEFAGGLAKDIERYDCPLLGGDTDHTPGPIAASIAAFGAVPHGGMVRRSTAKAGDVVIVTGTVGDAALGVKLRRDSGLAKRWRLNKAMAAQLTQRYLLPEPRNALAKAVRLHASAAMDVSDGLAGDLGKLCHASKVAAEIDVERVPLSVAAHAVLAGAPKLIETLLTGGDDYEIVLTLAPGELPGLREAAKSTGVALTEIGRIVKGDGARFMRGGKALAFKQAAYSHF